MEERDKIAARIRALLANTVENACTEDEAVAAAAKAAEMLKRYNLTVDEVELRKSPFSRHREHHDDEVGDRLWKIADAISFLTGSRYWTGRAGEPVEINFFGFEHEVDVSRYLLEICARAMRQEHKRLKKAFGLLVPAARRHKILPFLDGMADSLWRRIRALKEPEPTGTGLVVLRDQLITKAMADAGLKTQKRDMRNSRDFEISYRDGWEAGERVSLNRGLHDSEGKFNKQLTSR